MGKNEELFIKAFKYHDKLMYSAYIQLAAKFMDKKTDRGGNPFRSRIDLVLRGK